MTDVTEHGVMPGASGDANRVALQALVDAMPDGTTFLFPTGEYELGVMPGVGNPNRHSLRLAGRTNLRFLGDRATLVFSGVTGGANKSMIGLVSGCRGIVFEGLTFHQGNLTGGSVPLDEQTHSVELLPTTSDVLDTSFLRCSWGTIYGDCIRLVGDIGPTSGKVRRVRIYKCRMDGFKSYGLHPGYGFRAGLSVQRGVHDVTMSECYLTGSTDSVVDFEPAGDAALSGMNIHHCTFDHRSPGPSGVAIAVSLAGSGSDFPLSDSSFTDNLVLNGRVFVSGGVERLRFERNTIVDGDKPVTPAVLGFDGRCADVYCADNVIVGNAVSGAVTAVNVVFRNATAPQNITLSRNRVQWYKGYGIRVQSCPGLHLYDNTLVYSGVAEAPAGGIVVQATSRATPGVTVHNCTVRGGLAYGVRLIPTQGMSDVQITDCNVIGCATGIALAAGSWNDTPAVVNCRCEDCATPTFYTITPATTLLDQRVEAPLPSTLRTGPGAPGYH